jgi:hypothetical protein
MQLVMITIDEKSVSGNILSGLALLPLLSLLTQAHSHSTTNASDTISNPKSRLVQKLMLKNPNKRMAKTLKTRPAVISTFSVYAAQTKLCIHVVILKASSHCGRF